MQLQKDVGGQWETRLSALPPVPLAHGTDLVFHCPSWVSCCFHHHSEENLTLARIFLTSWEVWVGSKMRTRCGRKCKSSGRS